MAGSCVAGSINNGGLAARKDESSVGGGVFGLVGGSAAVGLADCDATQGEGMVQLAALARRRLAGLGGGWGAAGRPGWSCRRQEDVQGTGLHGALLGVGGYAGFQVGFAAVTPVREHWGADLPQRGARRGAGGKGG